MGAICSWCLATSDKADKAGRQWKDNRQSDPLISTLGKERYVTDFGACCALVRAAGNVESFTSNATYTTPINVWNPGTTHLH